MPERIRRYGGVGWVELCETHRREELEMAVDIRRIVTGHDKDGKAIVASDERLTASPAPNRPGISRVELWSNDKMPVDNSEGAAAEAQKKGFVVRHNYVGSGQGHV